MLVRTLEYMGQIEQPWWDSLPRYIMYISSHGLNASRMNFVKPLKLASRPERLIKLVVAVASTCCQQLFTEGEEQLRFRCCSGEVPQSAIEVPSLRRYSLSLHYLVTIVLRARANQDTLPVLPADVSYSDFFTGNIFFIQKSCVNHPSYCKLSVQKFHLPVAAFQQSRTQAGHACHRQLVDFLEKDQ